MFTLFNTLTAMEPPNARLSVGDHVRVKMDFLSDDYVLTTPQMWRLDNFSGHVPAFLDDQSGNSWRNTGQVLHDGHDGVLGIRFRSDMMYPADFSPETSTYNTVSRLKFISAARACQWLEKIPRDQYDACTPAPQLEVCEQPSAHRMRAALMALLRVTSRLGSGPSYDSLLEWLRLDTEADENEKMFTAFVASVKTGTTSRELRALKPVIGDPSSWVDPSNGQSLLHDAACTRHAGALRLMLAHTSDPDPKMNADSWWAGCTPLHWANSIECVRLLLDAGADTTIESTRHGITNNAAGWRRFFAGNTLLPGMQVHDASTSAKAQAEIDSAEEIERYTPRHH